MCSSSELLKKELKHIEEVLSHCKYPKWALDGITKQHQPEGQEKITRKKKGNNNQTKRCHIVVPYSRGLCESYKNICGKFGVQVHFKGGDILKNLLMFPEDKEDRTKQSNIIYWFKCGRTECDEEYIGESARTFEERYKEHLKAPSPHF